MPKTIFVIGMDDFNRTKLDVVERASGYAFRSLFTLEHVRERQGGDAGELIEEAKASLRAWCDDGGSVDGIIAYWDFPVQTLLPILRDAFDLPGPSLESVLKCEHKAWSRHEQRKVIPDHVPDVRWFDPFDPPEGRIGLPYPYWVKPVKATNSQLGFLIRDHGDLEGALDALRARVGKFGHWFDQFLARAELPPEIAGVRGGHCLAETILQGTQHTLSGWADDTTIQGYGVVDSDTYPERSSFSSYRYPSRLPSGVQQRMADVATLLMESLGFRWEAFNIEFFYDEAADRLCLLEVNPRFSQSHGDLFHKVDGMPNHKVAADLSLGRRPDMPVGAGTHAKAAKFYLRRFEDGVVTAVPGADDVDRVRNEFPDAIVHVCVREGDRLDGVENRDSYSVELAHLYLGGADDAELDATFARCKELLPFGFDDTL